jgi:hypothetical protein
MKVSKVVMAVATALGTVVFPMVSTTQTRMVTAAPTAAPTRTFRAGFADDILALTLSSSRGTISSEFFLLVTKSL